MSYILDALRKSEEQRRDAGAPDLTTEHRGLTASHDRHSRRHALIGFALLANALVLGAWLLWPTAMPGPADSRDDTAVADEMRAVGDDANTDSPDSTTAAATSAGQASAASPAGTAMAGEAQRAAVSRNPTATPATTVAATREPEEPAPAVPIRDLPRRLQERIPTLAFSTHIYAEEAEYREVAINGRRYAEGARIGELLLVEITEAGVVLELEGSRFAVSVLEDWDY